MPRYKLIVEYDGTNYAGWQKQDDQPTIQGALKTAIFKLCGADVDVIGAGRTDAGVHAIAQVAHVDLSRPMDTFKIMQGINFYLFTPEENVNNRIAVLHAEQVPDDFHARFSAKKRHYLYRIINRRARLALAATRAWHVVEDLDIDAMNKAAQYLIGDHDFTSFRDTECQAKSPLKTLEQLEVRRVGEEIHVITGARSFLHHQVRIMVGTMAMAGKGRWQPEDVKKALEAKNRSAAGPTAPPDGLYLTRVDY